MLHASRALFFFNDTATTEIYTLSLHDALPIFPDREQRPPRTEPCRRGCLPARRSQPHLRSPAPPLEPAWHNPGTVAARPRGHPRRHGRTPPPVPCPARLVRTPGHLDRRRTRLQVRRLVGDGLGLEPSAVGRHRAPYPARPSSRRHLPAARRPGH